MKRCLLLMLLCCAAFTSFAQLDSTGGTHVGFTVDADTKTGFSKMGPPTDSVRNNDDWFSMSPYSGTGKNVIDTSNSSLLRSELQAGKNISFVKRMSLPPYAIKDMRFWVDGIYFRDNVGSDSSAFSVASKNGDNPNNWKGGISSVQSKSDLIDVYTHVRTSGLRPTVDSVWFFAGVATSGTNGSRYFDIEVYRENFSYNKATGAFSSAGTMNGHSEWTFDANGNVTRTGDIVISVSYDNNSAPKIDFRIWVTAANFNTVKPVKFSFTKEFYSADGISGYAQIVSPNGTSQWGSGMGNYSSTASKDTTYSTPWGTVNTSGVWSQNYDRLQFVEIALNFSRFGMNPFEYVTSFCKSPYSSLIVKSRASQAFNANLVDFVFPEQFTVKNVVDYRVTPDTLSCKDQSATVKIAASARNYYRWKTMDGTLLRADSDSSNFTVFNPGTYVVEATNFQGCPAMKRDTTIVPLDNYLPVATIRQSSRNYQQLIGGDTELSNYSTPFGRSSGLTWKWSTDGGGVFSTEQSPIVDTLQATVYQLVVTENRNGCTDTSRFDFRILSSKALKLTFDARPDGNLLKWNNADKAPSTAYVVEKSTNGVQFVAESNPVALYSADQLYYFDNQLTHKTNHYRIRYTNTNNQIFYSNTVVISPETGANNFNITRATGSPVIQIAAKQASASNGLIKVLDLQGRVLMEKPYKLQPADTRKTLPCLIDMVIKL